MEGGRAEETVFVMEHDEPYGACLMLEAFRERRTLNISSESSRRQLESWGRC